ncbi:MAG TPA: LysM domain-containing protein [Chloroflexia bacterium]|nr:LysM domain-containing protein [Chloroflexia bacterium]
MKTLFGNSCAKGCMVYFVALLAIVAVTTMGLGGLKGRFSVDAQAPQGSILTVRGNQPGDVVGGGTLPTVTPIPPVQPIPTLVAPPGPTAPAGPVSFTPVPSQGGIISGETVAPFYIVQSGDTLSEIALRFHVSVDELRAINNLTGDLIQPGQLLYLPQSSQPQLQPTAIPTSSPQPLPQTGIDPTVVIPFMPNTGIIKKDGER